jgi:hypothetical protein
MTNNELAWKIFEKLKEKGCEIGNASVPIIERLLDEAAPQVSAIPLMQDQIAQLLAENAALLVMAEIATATIETQNEHLPALATALDGLIQVTAFSAGSTILTIHESPQRIAARKALAAYRNAPPVIVTLPNADPITEAQKAANRAAANAGDALKEVQL